MLNANEEDETGSGANLGFAAGLNLAKATLETVDTVLGEHPEGQKRGGTVAVCVHGDLRAFWNSTAAAWEPFDLN